MISSPFVCSNSSSHGKRRGTDLDMNDESDKPDPGRSPRGLLAAALSLLALAAVGAIGAGIGQLGIVDGLVLAICGALAGLPMVYAWFKQRKFSRNVIESEGGSSLEAHADRGPSAPSSWMSRILASPRFNLVAFISGLVVLALAIYSVSAYPSARNFVSLIIIISFVVLFAVLTIRRWRR